MSIKDASQSADSLFFQADQLLKNGDVVGAREVLERILQIDPNHGRTHNHLGWIYEAKYQDYAKADAHYKRALENAPEYPPLYLNYAVVLSNMGKLEELNALLRKAKTCPGVNLSRVQNEYGLMYEVQEKFDKAMDHFSHAIRLALNEKDVASCQASIERIEKKMASQKPLAPGLDKKDV
jgi:tetratricopeptide (TPR) repeat protein